MVGASLTVAQSVEYKLVWFSKEPADFGTEIAQLQTEYGAVTTKAAQAEAATGGASDAKALAETALEDATFVVARALAFHFKKANDLDRHGKVDLSKSEIVRLRNQELLTQATAIRDLATTAQTETDATKRGITAARLATLSAAITNFANQNRAPRSQIVNRSTLLREVETDIAALVEKVNDLDDLAVQFSGTEAGDRFVEAWKRARIIVDSGGGNSGNGHATPTSPTSSPAPAPTH
jgi:hypothetical protein